MNKEKVLIVDDHADQRFTISRMLKKNDYEVLEASTGKEALLLIEETRPSVILLDINLPELSGYDVVKSIKSHPELRYIPVLLVSGLSDPDDIIRGLDAGADDYIIKPFESSELLARMRAVLRTRELYSALKTSRDQTQALSGELLRSNLTPQIIGDSAPIKKILKLVEKVAPSNAPILILGESGTGKELIAQALHAHSLRQDAPFIARNCAAFTDTLLESELFGHVKGAFTGAQKDRYGIFEAANSGTLFLDEIGEMSLAAQGKLLRVLQESTYVPVGATTEKHTDIRLVCATNKNLEEFIKAGKFREDLFFRLNVITLTLPPLRERKEDLSLLIHHFLKLNSTTNQIKTVSPLLNDLLRNYDWPGNVRELRNEIQRLVILAPVEEQELSPEHLSDRILSSQINQPLAQTPTTTTLKTSIMELEKKMIADALKQFNGNRSNAAKHLGVSRSNLILKIRQYELGHDLQPTDSPADDSALEE